jgi:hypothetical protein
LPRRTEPSSSHANTRPAAAAQWRSPLLPDWDPQDPVPEVIKIKLPKNRKYSPEFRAETTDGDRDFSSYYTSMEFATVLAGLNRSMLH